MFAREMVKRAARNYPSKTAFICGEQRANWRQMDERSDRLAVALQTLGLEKGMTAAILSPECIQVHEHFYACMKTGAIRVGVNTKYAWPEIEYVLKDSNARFLVVEARCVAMVADNLDTLKALGITLIGLGTDAFEHDYDALLAAAEGEPTWPEIAPGDPLFYSYTSGTTGFPKGVVLTQQGLVEAVVHSVVAFGFSPDDVWYNPSASAWVTIAMSSFNLANGMTTVMPDGGFRLEDFLNDVSRVGVTSVILVPTMIQWVLREIQERSYDLSALRMIIYGSAPSSPKLIRDMREHLSHVHLFQTYGVTEATGGWATVMTEKDHQFALREKPELLSSVGRVSPHFECTIRDPDGNILPPNTRGELWLKGSALMGAYLNKPAETAEVMRSGGWMRTNDIATMDEDGFIFLLDRQKFMIITGAVNVFPATVEAVIYENPAVAEVSVVGMPHPEWGEAVVAFVKLADGYEKTGTEELTAFCVGHLSKPEIPKHFQIVDVLPKTPNGKIMKHVLKDTLLHRPEDLPWAIPA